MPPVHTALFAAISLLLLWLLALNTSRLRLRYQVFAGDGGHVDLLNASRAHGVAFEHFLPLIVGLLFLELLGAPHWLVDAFGALTLVARLAHTGVRLRLLRFRWGAWSMGVNYALEGALAVTVLVRALRHLA